MVGNTRYSLSTDRMTAEKSRPAVRRLCLHHFPPRNGLGSGGHAVAAAAACDEDISDAENKQYDNNYHQTLIKKKEKEVYSC